MLVMTILAVGILFASIFPSQTVLFGQGGVGSILGAVTDPSGAAVPGAIITATNSATNEARIVHCNPSGEYTVSSLVPGTYSVKAEMTGFKTFVQSNVNVDVVSAATVNIQLTLGSKAETIEVTAQVGAIETTKADVGTVITNTVLDQLPLEVSGAARQLDSFLFLTPGVTGGTFDPRFNGGPDLAFEIRMDGMPNLNADEGGTFSAARPPYDSVAEFKVEPNPYSAEFGRGNAAASFSFKSGTNQLHGSVFDILRNNALDSRGFFSPTVGTEKQNDFGVSVGGPVYIPHVYDGRNHTFWMFSYEGMRFRGGTFTSLITLPTAAELTGDFSGLVDANGKTIPIYDPTTTVSDGSGGLTRTQFPGNIIPANRLSATAKAFAPLFPTATLPGFVNNYLSHSATPFNQNDWMVKIDHSFWTRYSLHASFTNNSLIDDYTPAFPGPLYDSITVQTQTQTMPRITMDTILKPNLLNTIGGSFQRLSVTQTAPAGSVTVNSPISPSGYVLPLLAIGGIGNFGYGGTTAFAVTPNSAIEDTLSWEHGKNNMKIGADLRWLDEVRWPTANFPGDFSFVAATTSLPDSPNFADWGAGMASFMLGASSNVSRSNPVGYFGYRTSYYATYFQDDYRLTKKLTLNLGLRWEIPVGIVEKYNRLSTIDLAVPNPGAGNLPGALVFAGKQGGALISGGGASLGYARVPAIDYKEVAPRFGFAYALDNKTVVKGGYGMFYTPGGAGTLMGPAVSENYLTGYQVTQNLLSPDAGITPALYVDQGVAPIVVPPRSLTAVNGQAISYMGKDAGRSTYLEQWSFGFERELPGQILLKANYVGSHGLRLEAYLENLDQLDPKYLSLGTTLGADINSPQATAAGIVAPYAGFTGTVAQALRPYPQYLSIASNAQTTGVSHYNSLQMTAEKRVGQGLTFLVAYTLSKTLNDTNSQFAPFNSLPPNTYDRRAELALCGCDIPNNLVTSGLYALPIGPGKKFLNHGGAAGKVVGGWQLTFINTYQTGTPLAISGGPALPLFGGPNRPNTVPGQRVVSWTGGKFDPAVSNMLNRAAFTDPAQFTIGDATVYQGAARSFPYYNENLGLMKETPITERFRVEFRAELFNAFNRTEFGGPDTNFDDTIGYGTIGSQENTPRQIQFYLKLLF
jgi:hypothetical protein